MTTLQLSPHGYTTTNGKYVSQEAMRVLANALEAVGWIDVTQDERGDIIAWDGTEEWTYSQVSGPEEES
jgi:hypothetical protein